MSSQNPYESNPPSGPSSQQNEYSGANPYGQPQPGYGANPYGQPPTGYGASPYGQQQQPMMNPQGQPMTPGYAVPVAVPVSEPGKGMAIAGMVLGILSICLFWAWYIGIILGIVGVVLSGLAMRTVVQSKGMAIAGLVTSIVSLGLAICAIVFLASLFNGAFFHMY